MRDQKHGGAMLLPNQTSEPIVAFYLTQETDLPAKFQGEHQVVTINITASSGRVVRKPALRVVFSHDRSIEEPVGLVGFGSDPLCHVLLPADVVTSVHCRIYAQLNSGPRVWLVDDSSPQGTQVKDDETSREELKKTVHGRRQAAQGLSAIRIGPYLFHIREPISNAEIQRREDWFRLNQPVPVTRSMLDRQLGGLQCDWIRMDRVGKGGNGQVYRYMEKRTALFVAIKEEKLKHSGTQLQIKKEVRYMESLRHPYLVDIILSQCDGKRPVPTQYTVMPLYLGDLWTLLQSNPDLRTKERVLIQVFEGIRHMHTNEVLHRDLKPDNIFWVKESPVTVKVGDYGLATSLTDHHTLFERCGTVAYMAPEVFQGDIAQTTAIDVFSLGATVFAILEHQIVMRGWYTRGIPPQLYNRVFENVAKSPPKLYAGLVQSMMAPNPEDRPSLDTCIEVVKGKHYNWTKRTQLPPMVTATPVERARAWAAKRVLLPIAPLKKPEARQTPQQAPVKCDYKRQQDAMPLKEPKAPLPQAVVAQAPKPSAPAPVQGVNFQDGLPSYEEATSKNPFTKLADSREIARRRHRSKLHPPQDSASPVAEQRAKPALQQPKKPNTKHSSNSRQVIRRPREHVLDIRRTGAGRIRKTTLTGLKAGAIDMGKGLYQFGRGLGAATCNLGCLTAEGILMLYDLATEKQPPPPTMYAGLLLNVEERQLVLSMRAHSSRREAERQRARIDAVAGEEKGSGRGGAVGRKGGLRRIREGVETGGR